MYSKVYSIDVNNTTNIIEIEANILPGMFAFSIIGIKNEKASEVKERLISIIKNLGLKLPNKRIIINVIGMTSKSNYYYDLPILISLLSAMSIINIKNDMYFIGNLNLNGNLVSLKNTYEYIKLIKELKLDNIFISNFEQKYNFKSAYKNITFVENIFQIIKILRKENVNLNNNYIKEPDNFNHNNLIIKGQDSLIRGLIIALAGHHHSLIYGVSGSGKTLAIDEISKFIPKGVDEDLLTINANNFNNNFIFRPMILKTKENITSSYLFGKNSAKGLFEKADKQYVYIDEINTLSKTFINKISLLMEKEGFTLISTINPCPCGNFGSRILKCTCRPRDIEIYKRKLNKPQLDRFQIKLYSEKVSYEDKTIQVDLDKVKSQIKNAWKKQKIRYNKSVSYYNGLVDAEQLHSRIILKSEIMNILKELSEYYSISLRVLDNIIRVARTIADIENCEDIEEKHIYEAFQYQNVSN